MKTIALCFALILLTTGTSVSAQGNNYGERHSGALNLGLGIGGYNGHYGYYGEVGHSLPVINVNYELGVARNFTLAPFISLYSYSDEHYTAIVAPVGVKGTFYLDEALNAGSKWDFYLAGSLGVSLVSTTWDDQYNGDRSYYHSAHPLYLDFHVGTEYHISNQIGLFLDLSTGVSTIGLAFH